MLGVRWLDPADKIRLASSDLDYWYGGLSGVYQREEDFRRVKKLARLH
jgi:hypothetical protein